MGRKKQKKTAGGSAREQFEAQADQQGTGLIAEFWEFFRSNKKWWMIPIVVVLLLLAGLVLLGGTALAPFIYTLF
jgi:hypothetical protein